MRIICRITQVHTRKIRSGSPVWKESIATLEVYTEGIRRTDEALQLLVDQVEEFDEPTVIVFWVNCLPILGTDQAIYKEAGYETEYRIMNTRKYSETPLLIYSNFSKGQRDLGSVSPTIYGPLSMTSLVLISRRFTIYWMNRQMRFQGLNPI